jgi:hypothetical protein
MNGNDEQAHDRSITTLLRTYDLRYRATAGGPQ